MEAVKTNVIGTDNVLDVAIDCGVKCVICLSTDKAAYPINAMGISMLPGYTHNIINLSETENLVTVMYCNEIFDPNKPDTYFLPVE